MMSVNWSALGILRVLVGGANTAVATLLREVGAVVASGHARYVWRGQRRADWPLRTSLHRRLVANNDTFDEKTVASRERELLDEAHLCGWDRVSDLVGGSELDRFELTARLQHHGAATNFLDVTSDPFVALFFACEHARRDKSASALFAIRVDDSSTARARKYNPTRSDPPDYPLYKSAITNLLNGTVPKCRYLLYEPYPFDERIRVQHGRFLVGDIPEAAEMDYTSIPLGLLAQADELARIKQLVERSSGRPSKAGPARAVMWRITPSVGQALGTTLKQRFDYVPSTIYPDIEGFCNERAHDCPF